MQVLCGLQVVFFLFNCQTPVIPQVPAVLYVHVPVRPKFNILIKLQKRPEALIFLAFQRPGCYTVYGQLVSI